VVIVFKLRCLIDFFIAMKKNILLTLFLVLFCFYSSQAQSVRFGLKGGLNLALLSGAVNVESHFKPGVLLGGYANFPLAKKWYIQPELLFSGQGAKYIYLDPPAFTKVDGETKTNLPYLKLPLLVKFQLSERFSLHLGPEFGLLLASREKGELEGEIVDKDLSHLTKSAEIAVVGGMEFNVSSTVHLGGRLNFGLTDIYDGYDDIIAGFFYPPLNNRVIQLYIGYAFP
jgi:hypothetical protein